MKSVKEILESKNVKEEIRKGVEERETLIRDMTGREYPGALRCEIEILKGFLYSRYKETIDV